MKLQIQPLIQMMQTPRILVRKYSECTVWFFYFPFAPYRELQDSLLLGFRIPSRGFRIPAKYRSLSAELGFHSLLEFRISKAAFWSPKPCIPDFTSKNFQDSGIQIPVHGAISFLSLNHGELLNFWKKHFSISLLGCWMLLLSWFVNFLLSFIAGSNIEATKRGKLAKDYYFEGM